MDSVDVATTVYLPPAEVYEFLEDFPGYAEYSEYLRNVRAYGDGGPGTSYELDFAWWKLTYTARSEVTDVDPPTRIDWRITKDFVASGYWHVEPVEPPADREHASRVRFHVDFRPESADDDMLSLPRFVSLDWVIGKVKPKVVEEAERVVRRIVADVEGERREVDLAVRTDTEL